MNLYQLFSTIITFAVLIAYINHRYVRLQFTTAIMAGSLFLSLMLILIGQFGFSDAEQQATAFLAKIDFHDFLVKGILSFLLFAGALTVDINALKKRALEIGTLAFFGTIISTFLIALGSYYLLQWVGHPLPLIFCFLFGALISPTDPIAVLALFKEVKAPKLLNVTVAGESLFNDGVGIVIFITVYSLAFSHGQVTWQGVGTLFLREAVGGVLYGAALGLIGYRLIKPVCNAKIEILVTLAIVTGGYAFADLLEISGPLAMVVAGIFIGNTGKNFSMQKRTRENLDNFWELVDDILNALLFVLIGLEILAIRLDGELMIAAIFAIPLVLVSRFIIVAIPLNIFKHKRNYSPYMITILTWGGLRGGLAVALALAIPPSANRELILTMTYAVVAFSIIVQGLTIGPLVLKSKQ